MKKTLLIAALLCFIKSISAQPLSIGYLGGMGFSDYHGSYASGRWQSQGNALSSLFLRYDLTKVLSLGTEIGYSRQEYVHKDYSSYNWYIYYRGPYDYIQYYDPMPNYYSTYYKMKESWSYDFLRIPLYLTLSTPTKLQLSVSVGMYVSFRTAQDYYAPPWYPYYSWKSSLVAYPTLGNTRTPRHDNGMFYAASLSYPISSDFRIYAQGRLAVGHRNFLASKSGRTGSSEFALGLAYTGLFKSPEREPGTNFPDTAYARFQVSPRIGAGFSTVRKSEYEEAYAKQTSMTAGIQVEYNLDRNFSLVTGLEFNRKGYSFQDSSANTYRHAITTGQLSKVNTTVDLDYIVMPLLLKVHMGKVYRVFAEAGIYGAFNLNDRVTGSSEVVYSSESSYQKQEITVYDNLEGEVRDFETGWLVGAGIEIPAGSMGLVTLGVEYAAGHKSVLTKNDDRDRYLINPDSGFRNGFLNVQLGMVIPISAR